MARDLPISTRHRTLAMRSDAPEHLVVARFVADKMSVSLVAILRSRARTRTAVRARWMVAALLYEWGACFDTIATGFATYADRTDAHNAVQSAFNDPELAGHITAWSPRVRVLLNDRPYPTQARKPATTVV